ncbi:unnamed protein product [Meloidogyne enterolobii]|uniref:Uncharacterized protein n=1 Tax=Meloidogyne enterolobii TaxID=390850 RepID=A0ACB1AG33_MELEN
MKGSSSSLSSHLAIAFCLAFSSSRRIHFGNFSSITDVMKDWFVFSPICCSC